MRKRDNYDDCIKLLSINVPYQHRYGLIFAKEQVPNHFYFTITGLQDIAISLDRKLILFISVTSFVISFTHQSKLPL